VLLVVYAIGNRFGDVRVREIVAVHHFRFAGG